MKVKMHFFSKRYVLFFFQDKTYKIILILSTLFLIGLFMYYDTIPDKIIFPIQNNFNITTYTDKAIGGNSKITTFNCTDSLVLFEYVLHDSAYVHYVGMTFYYKNWEYFDISKYNQIKVTIESNKKNDIGVYLFSPNRYNSKIEDICFFEKIESAIGKTDYYIDFEKFKIPNWWFDVTRLSQNDNITLDRKFIHYLNIGNAYTTEINETNTVIIYSICFTRNNKSLLITVVFLEFLLLISLYILFVFKRFKLKAPTQVIEYKAIDAEIDNNKLLRFLDYIHNHFNEVDLTIEKVSSNTGINQRKIAHYIHDTYQCNFKTYVNNIRIEESKRLLISTDLNINEIADKVGYATQSYFNYVFKSVLGISPSQYRETNK